MRYVHQVHKPVGLSIENNIRDIKYVKQTIEKIGTFLSIIIGYNFVTFEATPTSIN